MRPALLRIVESDKLSRSHIADLVKRGLSAGRDVYVGGHPRVSRGRHADHEQARAGFIAARRQLLQEG